MPTLNEGTLFYMPTTLPGLSVTKAAELLQTQNKIIKSFPEIASVYGKAGRAATATDPAPTEMIETVINLKPESEWPAGMTVDDLIGKLDSALQFPGVSNAWTMPIRARIDMLSTGIRTPIGIKLFGRSYEEMDRVAKQIEAVVRKVPGTTSAFAERVIGSYYLNIEPDREEIARYGLTIGEVQDVIASALGGESVTTTVEGRERFAVNVRYPRELRDDPQSIATEVLVAAPNGTQVPLGQLAHISFSQGPSSIRTENAQLALYIFVDMRGRDIGGYVDQARAAGSLTGQVPAWHLCRLERPIRISGTCQGAAVDRRPGYAADHIRAALSQFPAFDRDSDCHAVLAVRPGRRPLVHGLARLQHVGGGCGRLHCPCGCRRRNRRDHADLPRARLGRTARTSGCRERPLERSDLDGAVMEGAVERVRPENDDRGRHHGRAVAHSMESRHRLGR
jgi:Cu(I)/Ag(I) efflux system membrane protein CusA/SilA